MNENRVLFNNTFFLTTSALAIKLIAYISFIIIVKRFTPEEIGIYAVIITAYLFMELFSNLGLDKILIRELSTCNENNRIKNLFYSSLYIRLCTALIVFCSGLILFKYIYTDIFHKYPVQLTFFFAAIFPLVFSKNIECFFISKEKMLIPAISQFIERTGVLCAALLVLCDILNFRGFITAFFAAILLRALFLAPFFPWKYSSDSSKLKKTDYGILLSAYKLLIVEIMAIIYFRVDIFMLSKMTDWGSTGIYQVSYKIFDFFIAIFAGFLTAMYPRLVRNKDNIDFSKILLYGFIVLSITSVFVIFTSDIILGFFGENYIRATVSLSYLMITLPFVFITSMMANYSVAHGKVGILIKLAMILITLNVILNYILIPVYSIAGSALSTLICETVSAIILIYVFKNAFQKDLKEIPLSEH